MKKGETAVVVVATFQRQDGERMKVIPSRSIISLPSEEAEDLREKRIARPVAVEGEAHPAIMLYEGRFIAGLKRGSELYVIDGKSKVLHSTPFDTLDSAMEFVAADTSKTTRTTKKTSSKKEGES